MKAKQLFVRPPVEASFNVRRDEMPNVNSWWHFHEEIELIGFHRGGGLQFVGDRITRFRAGDVVLVGPNLPHCWKYDEAEEDCHEAGPYSTVIHFQPCLLDSVFMRSSELAPLGWLIDHSVRGLLLRGAVATRLLAQMSAVCGARGVHRMIGLLKCLALFVDEKPKVQPLSSMGFCYQTDRTDEERINKVYGHSFTHFDKSIKLEEVADLVGLSRTSFCRFFKQRTGKTYLRFLTEIRIGYACRQLVEKPQLPIKQVCYASGFRNFTSFHGAFKQITGMSPKAYQALRAV